MLDLRSSKGVEVNKPKKAHYMRAFFLYSYFEI